MGSPKPSMMLDSLLVGNRRGKVEDRKLCRDIEWRKSRNCELFLAIYDDGR